MKCRLFGNAIPERSGTRLQITRPSPMSISGRSILFLTLSLARFFPWSSSCTFSFTNEISSRILHKSASARQRRSGVTILKRYPPVKIETMTCAKTNQILYGLCLFSLLIDSTLKEQAKISLGEVISKFLQFPFVTIFDLRAKPCELIRLLRK